MKKVVGIFGAQVKSKSFMFAQYSRLFWTLEVLNRFTETCQKTTYPKLVAKTKKMQDVRVFSKKKDVAVDFFGHS